MLTESEMTSIQSKVDKTRIGVTDGGGNTGSTGTWPTLVKSSSLKGETIPKGTKLLIIAESTSLLAPQRSILADVTGIDVGGHTLTANMSQKRTVKSEAGKITRIYDRSLISI